MPCRIVRDNIINVKADAIVNTANPRPVVGTGVDTAIYEAAGRDLLLAERRKIGKIRRGDAAATPAFALPAKCIIHTVGTHWRGGLFGERKVLASCYRRSLNVAKEQGCESIALPLLAAGVYGFPKDIALTIALDEIRAFLMDNDMDVTLVVFDREAYALSSKLLFDVQAFIDDQQVAEANRAEYTYQASEVEILPSVSESRLPGREAGNMVFGASPAENADEEFEDAEYSAEPGDYESGEAEYDEYEDRVLEQAARLERYRRFAADEELRSPMPPAGAGAPAKAAPLPFTGAPVGSAPRMKSTAPPDEADLAKVPIETVLEKTELPDFEVGMSFRDKLFELIDARGLTDPEVYKRANIDRKLFSKIRSNEDYTPKKKTALALAVALELTLEETEDLIARAGYALSPSDLFDTIIKFFISRRNYDIYLINATLFSYDQQLLGL
jgi:O-acetyl-ADP-ribose deacetylase (regulator of RNase III)